MEKQSFIYGSEKRFFEFFSKLNEKDKIALISHTDLDGIAAAKVVDKVIKPDLIRLANYTELNTSLIEELKQNKITKLILTDMNVNETFFQEMEKNFQSLIIDHHPPQKDFNTEKTVFINSQENCAAYISYYLFSKTQNIENLDWLVACACIADFKYLNNKKFMSKTLEKYNDRLELINNSIKKSGKFFRLQWTISLALIYFEKNEKKVFDLIGEKIESIKNLEKYSTKINKYVDLCLKKFEKEKQEINGRIFWEFNPKFKISSLICTIASLREKNKTFIIAHPNRKFYHFSIRRQDKGEDTNKLAKNLTSNLKNSGGGGHIAASGGYILIKDKEKLKENLKSV